jgi:hypothetical protein
MLLITKILKSQTSDPPSPQGGLRNDTDFKVPPGGFRGQTGNEENQYLCF